jgi:catechol 2,3-dioxygenase-like lactoylglutathione lyase family enzyme
MMQIQGIDHVAVNVRNLDESLRFYTQILGLKVTAREPSKPGIEYFLDCGPSLIGLIQAKNLENVHPFQEEGLGANHFSFRIAAKDFDGVIERLENHQVKIAFAKKRTKSWSLYFYDLDGNKLEMTAWPREDGLSEEQCRKLIYHPEQKTWVEYL